MLNCKDLYTEYIGVWNLSVIYFSKWSHATPEVDFPGGSDGKEYACNVGNLSSIPRSGKSPGEENGNSLQYSCLENSMDRGAWWGKHMCNNKDPAQPKRKKEIKRSQFISPRSLVAE